MKQMTPEERCAIIRELSLEEDITITFNNKAKFKITFFRIAS